MMLTIVPTRANNKVVVSPMSGMGGVWYVVIFGSAVAPLTANGGVVEIFEVVNDPGTIWVARTIVFPTFRRRAGTVICLVVAHRTLLVPRH